MDIKKKVIGDMFLNIIAVTIPVAILQLVVYPITAKAISAENYGLMLTIYSAWVMVSNSIGNVLNNIRLLHNSKYIEKKIKGDFNILFRRWSIINSLIIIAFLIFYCKGFNGEHIFLGVIVSLLILTKDYTEVGFRLKLNYRAIVVNNALQGIGFLLGMYITINTGIWEFIFIAGYLFGCTFCVLKTKLMRDPLVKTELFTRVNNDTNKLVIASVIGNMMNYADKLILYPIMGGYAVSIYYTATILGKIIGMLTGPINSVVLSYISRWDSDKKNILNKILIIGTALCIIGYIITLVIAKPIIGLLFKQWVDEVMCYIPITTINVLLLTLISIISPFVLKFCDMKWQIIINCSSVAVYFVAALVLWKLFGLTGFCIGTVIGTVTKLVIMLFVYYGTKENMKIDKEGDNMCNSEI